MVCIGHSSTQAPQDRRRRERVHAPTSFAVSHRSREDYSYGSQVGGPRRIVAIARSTYFLLPLDTLLPSTRCIASPTTFDSTSNYHHRLETTGRHSRLRRQDRRPTRPGCGRLHHSRPQPPLPSTHHHPHPIKFRYLLRLGPRPRPTLHSRPSPRLDQQRHPARHQLPLPSCPSTGSQHQK